MRCRNTFFFTFYQKIVQKLKYFSTAQYLTEKMSSTSAVLENLPKFRENFLIKHKNLYCTSHFMPFHANRNLCLLTCQNLPCLIHTHTQKKKYSSNSNIPNTHTYIKLYPFI